MLVVLIKILQVILALSVLVFVHELGHFTFARIFGIKVEKFYLFFDIGGKALFKFKKGDTEYGIGWLPLGGYCKIAGMIDESMDLESMKRAPQAWEFRTHPAWQRLLVMAGGVLYNFIFAIIAYISILAIWGSVYVSNEENQIYVNELAYEMGFRNGDRILAFDDYRPQDFSMLQADLARRNVHYATVLRASDTLRLYIDQAMISEVLNTPGMFDLALPFVVDSLVAGSPNLASGVMRGDRIIAVEGTPVQFIQDARPLLAQHAGGTAKVDVMRDSTVISGISVQVDSLGHIGLLLAFPGVHTRHYNFFSAIPDGTKLAFSTVAGYLRDLNLIFKPSTGAYKSVGSFVALGQAFPAAWDWYRFVSLLALISIMLGVMNLLPIPGLDGGHILFLLYEILTRRKPGEKFLVGAQILGMFLLLLLMAFACGNDIGRLF